MTRSEELVFKLCSRSFLSLWSYANPLGKQGKELCDVLVVCDPDVIIFSVKEVRSKESGDVGTDWSRWTREAIDRSVKQIYGAERWLRSAPHVVRKDGSAGLPLPDPSVRRVYRIAVALGSEGKIPIASRDRGKGYVHVLEEGALQVLMWELDTIADFTEYLRAKEALLETTKVVVQGEENLLAGYLRAGRRFEHAPDLLIVEGDIWDDLVREEPYMAKRRADKESRAFDVIIETFCKDALAGTLGPGATLSEAEQLVRVMARESRFNRRGLGKAFMEFYEKAAKQEAGLARLVQSLSGVVYMFLALPRDFPREDRKKLLTLRCIVARGMHPDSTTVVGIATERYEGKPGFSFDGCFLHMPTWAEDQQAVFEGIQKDLGFFVNAERSWIDEQEYPERSRRS